VFWLSQYLYNEDQWAPLNEVPFKLPLLQNHRGFVGPKTRENTLESISKSFELGYRMIETDLRLTKEGSIILFHDPLKDQPEIAKATKLEAILEMLPKNRYCNLEIKNETKTNFLLEEKIIQVLKDHPKRDQILLSSFNPFSLAWMTRLVPEIPRALLVTQEHEPGNSFFLRELTFLSLVKPHFLNLRWQDLDHYKDIPAERKAVWTLNDLDMAKTLIERKKVASIITDSILPEQIEGA
jgi:glycerophosphoryl diester phosphodiesterase